MSCLSQEAVLRSPSIQLRNPKAVLHRGGPRKNIAGPLTGGRSVYGRSLNSSAPVYPPAPARPPPSHLPWMRLLTEQRFKATRADQRGYSVRVGGREGERLFFDRNISRGTQDVTDRVLCTANTRACACSRVCTQGVSGPCAEIFSRNRPSCTALTRVLTRTAALLSQ